MRIDASRLPAKGCSREERRLRRKALAELRDAERKRRRRESRKDEERTRKKAAEVIAASRHDHPMDHVERIFGARARRSKKRNKPYHDFVRTLHRRAPDLLCGSSQYVLNRLGRASWRRDVKDWRPLGRGRRSRLRSLLEHLLALYPVPAFMVDTYLDPDLAGCGAVNFLPLFERLGRGESAFLALRHEGAFANITRRGAHLFTTAPRRCTVDEALCRALVLAHGGEPRLAAPLAAAEPEWLTEDPRFWAEVVHWFCRQGELDVRLIDTVVRYLDHRRYESSDFSVVGRSLKAVVLGCREWRRTKEMDEAIGHLRFPKAAWREGDWDDVGVKTAYRRRAAGTWRMNQILTGRDLMLEGRSMKHCVAQNADWAADGDDSYWSLTHDGMRRLTVEVCAEDGAIMQAKGKCNRDPDPMETMVLTRWAGENGLKIDPSD